MRPSQTYTGRGPEEGERRERRRMNYRGVGTEVCNQMSREVRIWIIDALGPRPRLASLVATAFAPPDAPALNQIPQATASSPYRESHRRPQQVADRETGHWAEIRFNGMEASHAELGRMRELD